MYERIIYETGDHQWRVTINTFNGIEYFHFRKYILDFEENWIPIKEGVSFPLDLDNVKQLFIAMLEILSLAESKSAIEEHFKELLADLYV
ncbi:hypothetical protein EBZ38_01635 [bacterium]|nr:hypothetical protein [bacterium]